MSAEKETGPTLESIPLSEAEIVPSVRVIIDAIVYCFDRFGASAKEDVAKTLSFKTRDRGLNTQLEDFPGANKEFVRQALIEAVAELQPES